MAKKSIANFLGAVANDNRFAILLALREREHCVSELCDALGLGQSLVSHSLRKLAAEQLIRVRSEGAFRFYALEAPTRSLVETIIQVSAACQQHCPAIAREQRKRLELEHALRERDAQLRRLQSQRKD